MRPDDIRAFVEAITALIVAFTGILAAWNKVKVDSIHDKVQSMTDCPDQTKTEQPSNPGNP